MGLELEGLNGAVVSFRTESAVSLKVLEAPHLSVMVRERSRLLKLVMVPSSESKGPFPECFSEPPRLDFRKQAVVEDDGVNTPVVEGCGLDELLRQVSCRSRSANGRRRVR